MSLAHFALGNGDFCNNMTLDLAQKMQIKETMFLLDKVPSKYRIVESYLQKACAGHSGAVRILTAIHQYIAIQETCKQAKQII